MALTLTVLGHGAHRDTLARRCGEHPDHLVLPATRPDDAVGTPFLHAIHLPAPTHQYLASDDYDSLHRRHVDVFGRLPVDDLGPRVSVGGTGAQPEARERQQIAGFHPRSSNWVIL